jgi:DNA-directed RNA polymerases I, II, and III subunit RPABC1
MLLITKLEKSRGVILQMLEDRGYNVDEYKNYTVIEIDSMYKNTPTKVQKDLLPLDIICSKDSQKIIIKYVFNSKIKASNIESLIEDMKEDGLIKDNDSVLFILKDKISNEYLFDTQIDLIYNKLNIFIQVFWLDTLIINITHHELVPKHDIISNEEKMGLLIKYDINNLTQLPIIIKTDPIAKYLGMKRGDVCVIKRPSETSGVYISYRYCQ